MVSKAVQAVLPILGQIGGPRQQPFLFISVERAERRRRGHRIAGIGVAMEELDQLFRAIHEGVMDLVTDKHRPHGNDPAGQPLGGGDDIGLYIEIIAAKVPSRP